MRTPFDHVSRGNILKKKNVDFRLHCSTLTSDVTNPDFRGRTTDLVQSDSFDLKAGC